MIHDPIGTRSRPACSRLVAWGGIVKSLACISCFGRLARIIHEGPVNNPGLPDQERFPPAAGEYLGVGGPGARPASRGRGAVSRRPGDA